MVSFRRESVSSQGDLPLSRLHDESVAGDHLALEKLLELCLPELRRYVRQRCGKRVKAFESASDIVASVCQSVLATQKPPEVRSTAQFKAWLFQAARHRIVDSARRAGLRGRRGFSSDGDVPARGRSPSQAAHGNEQVARIERGLQRLSPQDRELILLSAIEGLTSDEVGAALGLTAGTVRQRLRRARMELSRYLIGE